MPRPLFTLAALLSLVLCVAVAVLWVRSYWRTDAVGHAGPGGIAAVQWYEGVIVLGRDDVDSGRRGAFVDSWPVGPGETPGPTGGWWPVWGFGKDVTTSSFGRVTRLFVPLWPLFLASCVLPLLWLYRHLWHRFPAGHCQSCGYDLRETPQRCPECGREMVGPKANAVA